MTYTHPLEVGLKSEASEVTQPVAEELPFDHDAHHLARSGKKQVLRRRFGIFGMIGLACVALISWEAAIDNFGIGLKNGGPAGLIYAVIFVGFGMGTVYSTLSELASMSPTAGGQYHWASFLAPRSLREIWSYLTGWVTVLTWVAISTGASYFAATVLQTTIQLTNPSYDAQPYQGTLIMWAILAVSFLLNTSLGSILPRVEFAFLVLHIVGFFAFLIPIAYLGPHTDPVEVFTRFHNGGGWATDGLSFMVGLQGTVLAFAGFDCVVHMAEEVTNAKTSIPQSIMSSYILNAILTFIIVIVYLLRVGNFDDIVDSDNPYIFINITQNATGSVGAAVALTSTIIFMSFACTVSSIAAGSRMIWSFARDRGVPFWKHIRKVDPQTRLPTISIATITIISGLLGLINIGSTVAFYAFTSLGTAGFCSSYLCVLCPLLYQRIKGNVLAYAPGRDETMYERPDGERNLVWGPWHIKGLLGILNNAFACAFLVVATFFSFWPTVQNVTGETFNFSVVIFVGVLMLSGIYYAFRARKTFVGPVIEIVL